MKAIPLANSQLVALVDDEDFEAASKFKWVARKVRRGRHYAQMTTASDRPCLHQFVADRAGISGRLIDHKNGDGLDNRRENLRGCTHAQNAWNVRRKTGASGHPGVCKNRNHWAVRFDHEGQRLYFGTFRDLEEAKRVASAAMARLRGDFYVQAQ